MGLWRRIFGEPRPPATHQTWVLTDISGSLGNELWEPEDCYCAATSDHFVGEEVS